MYRFIFCIAPDLYCKLRVDQIMVDLSIWCAIGSTRTTRTDYRPVHAPEQQQQFRMSRSIRQRWIGELFHPHRSFPHIACQNTLFFSSCTSNQLQYGVFNVSGVSYNISQYNASNSDPYQWYQPQWVRKHHYDCLYAAKVSLLMRLVTVRLLTRRQPASSPYVTT